ncbi:radical SAM family heme chaperone HemW [Chitinasiproducens palmae]|uniref:radical SAM family heme chaperone HemW n=1 Tax=Chitinasiproducens palmae TaxID=1770053 RepID=UPI000B811587|nr:radical SAM family heme chaperone HemW [Chitinasiproducens palmae]
MAAADPNGATGAAGARPAIANFLVPGRIALPGSPPLALYVHFPWCVRKCPYCDFNSHEAGPDGIPETRYLDALVADLESALPLVWGRAVHSVFIGGGTPSLLSAAGMDRLLGDLRARLPIDPDAEITMEANPGTFEAARFAEYRKSGVNRLSIGIQSFDARFLAALGRIHDDQQARSAVEIAARTFDNFNLDLMYALPGQSLDDCRADVETALSFAPPHLSLYHLTLEPNTYFHKYPPSLPDDDLSADMQEWIEARTAEAGFEHYEVSAYARPGRRSRHNVNYWEFGDYLGIGAGAHGKLSFPERVLRQARFKQPQRYMDAALAGDAVQEAREVAAEDLPFEFMLNALRLTNGVAASRFTERTGLPSTVVQRRLAEAAQRGLLQLDPTRIAPTELGHRFLNDLQALFLRD